MSDVSLGNMYVAYKADTSDLTSKMSQAKSAMSSANDTAQSSGGGIFSAFTNAGSSFIDFAAKAGQALAGVQNFASSAVSLGEDLLGPAESAETMDSAFTTLLGSTKAANDEMNKLDQFASKTPFTTLDIDKAGSELIAFKTSASDVVPELTAIGDELGSVGRGSAANMDSVVNIFGKIRTEGKLTIGTMQELAINGIDSWTALEKSTGKSKDELTSMISAGLIPASDAINDMTKGIEANPLYAGGMARQSNTMTGLVSTLKSNWDQMLASFGSPIIQGLEPELNNIGSALSSPQFKQFAGTIGQDIVVVFRSIGSTVQQAEPILQGVGLIFIQIADGWSGLTDGMDTSGISSAFNDLKTSVGGLGTTFQLVGPFINNLDNFLINLATDGAQLVGPSFLLIGQVITGANGAIQGIILSVEGQFLPALQNLEQQVFPVVASFENWLQKSGLINIVFGTLKIGMTLLIAGISLLINIGAGLIHFFTQTEVGSDLLKAALILLGTAFTVLAIVGVVAFISMIPELVAGFWTSASGAWGLAAGVIGFTWPILAAIAIIALIILAVTHWGSIMGWIHDVVGIAADGINAFFGTIGGVIHYITGGINDDWAAVGSKVASVWSGIAGGVKGGINLVIGAINGFIGFIDGIQIHIPSIGVGPFQTPSFDWNGVGLKKIPLLASGGSVGAGQEFIAGEKGPELIRAGSSGASVSSNSSTMAMIMMAVISAMAAQQAASNTSGEIHMHNHVHLDGRELTEAMGPYIGDVIREQGAVRTR